MSISHVLTSETGLTLLGGLLGTIWTAFKSSEWFGRRRRRKLDRAVAVLEAAVEETYRTYVQAIREAREDGKLTPAEKRRARELAKERAILLARREGLDVVRVLGEDFINLWIARLVRRLKNG